MSSLDFTLAFLCGFASLAYCIGYQYTTWSSSNALLWINYSILPSGMGMTPTSYASIPLHNWTLSLFIWMCVLYGIWLLKLFYRLYQSSGHSYLLLQRRKTTGKDADDPLMQSYIYAALLRIGVYPILSILIGYSLGEHSSTYLVFVSASGLGLACIYGMGDILMDHLSYEKHPLHPGEDYSGCMCSVYTILAAFIAVIVVVCILYQYLDSIEYLASMNRGSFPSSIRLLRWMILADVIFGFALFVGNIWLYILTDTSGADRDDDEKLPSTVSLWTRGKIQWSSRFSHIYLVSVVIVYVQFYVIPVV